MSWIAAVITAFAVSANSTPKSISTDYALASCLGQPCKVFEFLGGASVYNPLADKELLVLASSGQDQPMSLVFVDPKAQRFVTAEVPLGRGASALTGLATPNLLAVGTHPDGGVAVFDMEKWAFVATAKFPGESHIWNFVPGKDGRYYFGTYAGGKLGALDSTGVSADPPSITLDDCGTGFPPNQYLRRVSALPDGRILCSFETEQPGLRVFEPATKRFSDAPAALAGITSGVVWNGYFVSGDKTFNAALEPVTPPPFPPPPADKGSWQVVEEATSMDRLFLKQGNALWCLDTNKQELALVCDLDLRGGRLVAASHDGGVYGLRGQQYFHIVPGATRLERKPLRTAAPPRPPQFLEADGGGNIWGGSSVMQTLFMANRDSGVDTNTDIVVDGKGYVYGMVFINGVGYGVCDANGDIFRIDPNIPWNQFEGKNPAVLASLGPRGYFRPVAGVRYGPENRLYSGWMAKPGVRGGAVAVTDVGSGATDIIENPFGKQTVSGLGLDENYLYVGTSLDADGLPPTKGESAQFGVLGIKARQPLLNKPFDGATTVDRVLANPLVERVVFAVDGSLRVFDVEKMTVLPPFEPEPPRVTSRAIAFLGDNCVYYGSGKQIIRFDPVTGTPTVLLELPGPIGAFAGEFGGDLYAACGVDVYRITRKLKS